MASNAKLEEVTGEKLVFGVPCVNGGGKSRSAIIGAVQRPCPSF